MTDRHTSKFQPELDAFYNLKTDLDNFLRALTEEREEIRASNRERQSCRTPGSGRSAVDPEKSVTLGIKSQEAIWDTCLKMYIKADMKLASAYTIEFLFGDLPERVNELLGMWNVNDWTLTLEGLEDASRGVYAGLRLRQAEAARKVRSTVGTGDQAPDGNKTQERESLTDQLTSGPSKYNSAFTLDTSSQSSSFA
ncbi:hypothetical protein NCC49_004589 [Naganishia albida]|nr:hypothetical protein NCC49_004589 [Naganishia albida]